MDSPSPLGHDGLLSWEQIAQLLGLPLGTVRHTYTRALLKLRTALAAEGITEDEFRAYLHLRAQVPLEQR